MRAFRVLFFLLLWLTVLVLLVPGHWVLAAKDWMVQFLPWEPDLDRLGRISFADKLVHWGLFAATAYAGARAWVELPQVLRVGLGLLVVGALTELLQAHVPGRGPSLADWVADAMGVVAGILIAQWTQFSAAGQTKRA